VGNNYIEYYTIVNQDTYRLVASKANKFSDTEKELIKGIVDGAEYKLNPIYENEKWGIQKFWDEYGIQTVVVINFIGIVIGAVVLYKKRKNIKGMIKGKKETKAAPAPKSVSAPKSAPVPKPKKPADSSMVTIDRSKRKPRKK
jgi:hypothetical protein